MQQTAQQIAMRHGRAAGRRSPGSAGDLWRSRAVCPHHPHFSPIKGAGRAWGLVCALLLFFFGLPGRADAVPSGTIIDNTAQAAYRSWGVDTNVNSNTHTLVTDRLNTPAQIELLQYAPAFPAAPLVPLALAEYDQDGVMGGSTVQIATVTPAGGGPPIDLLSPVPLVPVSVYHQGEPIFFRVNDMDQNLYPAVAETIWVLLSVPSTAEAELLLLTETGPDTGSFVGYIQSSGLGAIDNFNGVLEVSEGDQIQARYTDIVDASDTVAAAALVDPYGLVFDSATGQPVDNVQLTLVDDATGSAATVFGDDGTSTFPSTIMSGGTYIDSSGKVYAFPSGGYRFPFVAPGTYRLEAVPPSGYSAPSSVPTAILQTLPGAPFVIVDPGSRGEAFILNPGPAVRIDIPVDPTSTGLWLQKSAGRDVAAVGDFIPYTVTVENNSGAPALNVTVADQLPIGFRYRKGSARLDGANLVDPQVAADGRTLTFAIGDMVLDGSSQIRYVAEIAAGARPGQADNRARAAADGGLTSNQAVASVTVKEDLFRSGNFIAGRVIADNCSDDPTDAPDGVPGVRIYLEDGTYVVTDEEGKYHFEGVASGTHVVQLDLDTLPAHFEIDHCEANSRHAGTPFSRFVDLQGGTLWRADFHVKSKAPPTGRADLKLTCDLIDQTVNYQALINIQQVGLANVRLSVILPMGSVYVPGSSRLADQPAADPQIMGQAMVYRLGDMVPDQSLALQFGVRLNGAAKAGRLHTKAVMTFDSGAQKNQNTPMIDTVLALSERKTRQVQPPIIVRPQFDILSARLTPQDQKMLDQLVAKLQGMEIEHVVFTGHTDNRTIRSSRKLLYPDNYFLSLERADNVARYLGTQLNLTPAQMTIVGKGADQPLADNATEAGRAQNRRVEVKVMSVKVNIVHDIASIKCEDRVTTGTQGQHRFENPVAHEEEPLMTPVHNFDAIAIESLAPGFAWVMPAADFNPTIASIKVAIQHDPRQQAHLLLAGRPVHGLTRAGSITNTDHTVQVSMWSGVGIAVGDNRLTAVLTDHTGKEIDRLERMVHCAGPPVQAQFLKAASQLTANGKDTPVIAVRLTDKDGYPARFGTLGEFRVMPPHTAYVAPTLLRDDLNRTLDDTPRYRVGPDGVARIKLEPTTQSGNATLNLLLDGKTQEIRVWLQPELRDWILVGLAEGTLGYHTVSGNMENLDAARQEEDYYQDGRMAFFAKGRIKGRWLLTAAYDSGRDENDPNRRLFQTIDPDTYYTLYGDAADQQYEASSIRKLYLKIERERFYALFGDYDTDLSVTELSRYSRRLNGLKSEYQGERAGLSVFASDTDQAFIKDEIRGDGTSGLYRLSRRHIVINSETVTIETRDRFHSEEIVASQTMARHIDYNIDYEAGTLYFKAPVYSRDPNFNPIYIVIDYESGDAADQDYTYGGRGTVKLAGGKTEVGATYIHEGPDNAEADLGGLDARVDLADGLQLKAEVATTRKKEAGQERTGEAYLAEVTQQSDNLDAKLYFREQDEDFGLGQQNGGESGTRKIGADADWQINPKWSLDGQLYRHHNLATEAERDVGESHLNYTASRYSLRGGVRMAEDRYADGSTARSNQIIAGAGRQFLDNRLQLRLDHEQSIGDDNANLDYPTRTLFGTDYQLADPVRLFAEHEITQGQSFDSQSSRAGFKATPWQGGQVGSSVGHQIGENGDRLFANLGLTQSWQINDRWRLDGGLDRTQKVSGEARAPFDTDVPTAAGAQEDFTALSLALGYKVDLWSWTGRVESRVADSQDKWGLITGIAGEVRPGLGLSGGMEAFNTVAASGDAHLDGNVRLSLAYRPKNTRWIVFDRLEYKFENRKDETGEFDARRIVNNLNTNYKPFLGLQLALQYGAKYVFDTIDGSSYSGYTDLTGIEVRYDLTSSWDIGLQASLLHSWDAGQLDYRTGLSVGYAMFKNTWLSVGYNLTGFSDEDFSSADYTAAGPYMKFRMKFDQKSVKEMVNWMGRD